MVLCGWHLRFFWVFLQVCPPFALHSCRGGNLQYPLRVNSKFCFVFFYGKISCVSFSLLSLWPTPCTFLNFYMQFVNSTCNTKAYAVFGISNSSSISQSITFLMNPNAANVIYLLIVRHFSSCLWTQCGMISNSKKFRSSILDGEIYVEITSLQASRNKTMMSFARKETLFTLE